MKDLRKFGAIVVLTFVLSLSAFAGEVLTPPCTAPEPGEVLTPPCGAAPQDMDTSEGPNVSNATLVNDDTSLTEIATDVVLNILSLY